MTRAPRQGARSAIIAALNDTLRTTLATGTVMLTPGLQGLPPAQLRAVIEGVRRFTAFTPDNDPYGEHDFGAIDLSGLAGGCSGRSTATIRR